MALALLLHFIQHLAFGDCPKALISPESFLQRGQRRSTNT